MLTLGEAIVHMLFQTKSHSRTGQLWIAIGRALNMPTSKGHSSYGPTVRHRDPPPAPIIPSYQTCPAPLDHLDDQADYG